MPLAEPEQDGGGTRVDERMTKDGFVRSTCAICFAGCGVLVHLRDGKVVEVKGNPHAPLSNGVLCPKGRASVEYLYHPDQIGRAHV
jgi:thiosulfate reductase / polysulfide reductase chain A